MPIDVQSIKKLIDELVAQVDALINLSDRDALRREYQQWLSQTQIIVNKYSPESSREYQNLYYMPSPTSDGSDDAYTYYGIRSYLRNTSDWSNKTPEFRNRFKADIEQQRGILMAIPKIIDMRASDLATLVTADLIGGELNEAKHLLDHGFVRAAGALAGVALEAHLKLLHNQSTLNYEKTDTINPLANRLRQADKITLGDEKKCIAMADTRNKCDHKNRDEPTPGEVDELIGDVERFVKRVHIY